MTPPADSQPSTTSYTPLTPLSFLERSAVVFAEKTAVVDGGRRFTFRELQERVFRLASALQRGGLAAGDRVAFLCRNLPPLLEAHFGVPWAGGVLVALNTRLSPDEVAYILDDCEARYLFVDAELASTVAPILERLARRPAVVNIVDPGAALPLDGAEYESFLASSTAEALPIPVRDENALISINYTSGTTGRPKGVMYSHRGAYLNALGVSHDLKFDGSAVYLWTLPMFHCNGWCTTWAVPAAGATSVCLRRIDPEVIFRLLREERVSHFCAAPAVLIALISHRGARELRLERYLRIATGGAPPSPTVVATFESLGAEVVHLYGLTETYGPSHICEWQAAWDGLALQERARLKARQGVGHVTASRFRVVDDAMRDVPADGGTMGEVVIAGNTVMLGYYRQPDATAEAFAGGWFHTGDLAVMHADGYMEVRDRKKDIIISGGENISTIEVENVVYQHPDVQEVSVIAVPDERFGEVPKAFVTPKPGVSLTAEALIAFCRERMPHFKAPKHVEFCDLPKTSTGKIQKFVLREKEWAGYERRIN